MSDTSVRELSSVEAFNFFKAAKEERGVDRIEHHYEHVDKACKAFKAAINQEISSQDLVDNSRVNPMGAQVSQALALLNAFLAEIQDSTTRLLIAQLQQLVRDGVITYIAKRLQRMSKRLHKGLMSKNDAFDEVIRMAKKYNDYFIAEDDRRKTSVSEPNIILSESFK